MWIFNLSRKQPRKRLLKIGDRKRAIKHAFSIKGKDFYQFESPLDMPVARWHYSSVFNEELQMGITKEALEDILGLIEEHLNQGDLVSASYQLQDLRYRVENIYDTEIAYKLASVVFFTLEEDLTNYDNAYNQDKIALFKTKKMEDFFLNTPAKDLIPFGNLSANDMKIFLTMNQARLAEHRKIVEKHRASLRRKS